MHITNKLNRLIAAFILGASVLTGCVQKEDGGYDVVEQESAKQMVRFTFDLDEIAPQTKSSYVTASTEGKVNNISVFIFAGGDLYYSGYAVTSGSIVVPMDPGATYDAYAFVNMGDLSSSITSLSQLQDYKYTITSSNLSGGLPMYGNASIAVNSSTRDAQIPVKRLVGRYELRLSDENLSAGATIQAKSVQVKNMASSVSPYRTDYVATGVVSNGDYSSASDISALNAGGGVYYYVAENLQGNEDGITEPNEKIPTYGYTVVDPDLSTYLEVKCVYSKGGSDADVTYRLFLGENSTDDFNIRRNTSYIITLAPNDLKVDDSWWKCEPDIDYDYVLSITPASQTVKAGNVVSYVAKRQKYLFGEYQMGLDEDVTNLATWSVVSGSSYVNNNGQGEFEGKGNVSGTATITASYDGDNAESPATLDVIGLQSLSLVTSSTMNVGDRKGVTVTARYNDNSTESVTSKATYTFSHNGIVHINNGYVYADSPGNVTITAHFGGMTATKQVTVNGAADDYTLDYLVVELNPSSISVGETSEVTVWAYWSDGDVTDITEGASISSVTTSVATLDGSTLTGVAEGTSSIRAYYDAGSHGSAEGSATLYVGSDPVDEPTVSSLEVVLTPSTIEVGGTSSVSVIAHMSDGTPRNVTGSATISSGTTSVATLSGSTLTGVKAGTSTISASYDGKSGSAMLTVRDITPTVDYIEVELAKDVIVVNNTTSATVWAHMSNGSVIDVTSSASKTTASSSIATISGSTVTGKGVGTTEVRATYGGKSASASIKVIANISITSVSSGTVSAVYYDARNGSHTEGSITRTSAKITVRISGAGNDITSECLIRQTSGIGYMSIDSNGNVTSDYDPTMAIREPANSGSYKSSTADATFEFTYVDEAGVEHTTSRNITMTLVRDNGSTNYRN